MPTTPTDKEKRKQRRAEREKRKRELAEVIRTTEEKTNTARDATGNRQQAKEADKKEISRLEGLLVLRDTQLETAKDEAAKELKKAKKATKEAGANTIVLEQQVNRATATATADKKEISRLEGLLVLRDTELKTTKEEATIELKTTKEEATIELKKAKKALTDSNVSLLTSEGKLQKVKDEVKDIKKETTERQNEHDGEIVELEGYIEELNVLIRQLQAEHHKVWEQNNLHHQNNTLKF